GLLQPLDIASFYVTLGKDLRELGRFEEAEAALGQSLERTRQSDGTQSAQGAAALRILGIAQMLAGDFAKASATLDEVVPLRLKNEPPTSPNVALAHVDVGNIRRLQHRYADALRELEAADDLFAKNTDESNPWRPQAVAGLSETQLDMGSIDSAVVTAERALSLARKALPKGHYQLGIPLFALARAELAQGRAADAEPLLREALMVRSPPHPADDPRVLEVNVCLVNALRALHREDEARALRSEIEPVLKASASPYAAELRARLATGSS
ncbi:MAG: tetratricopeptide repeat protein, partial [Rhodanobacteraceae bacterium]